MPFGNLEIAKKPERGLNKSLWALHRHAYTARRVHIAVRRLVPPPNCGLYMVLWSRRALVHTSFLENRARTWPFSVGRNNKSIGDKSFWHLWLFSNTPVARCSIRPLLWPKRIHVGLMLCACNCTSRHWAARMDSAGQNERSVFRVCKQQVMIIGHVFLNSTVMARARLHRSSRDVGSGFSEKFSTLLFGSLRIMLQFRDFTCSEGEQVPARWSQCLGGEWCEQARPRCPRPAQTRENSRAIGTAPESLCVALAVRHVCFSHQPGAEKPVGFCPWKSGMKALGGSAKEAPKVRRRLEILSLGCVHAWPRGFLWPGLLGLLASGCRGPERGLHFRNVGLPVVQFRIQDANLPQVATFEALQLGAKGLRSAKMPRTPASSSRACGEALLLLALGAGHFSDITPSLHGPVMGRPCQ